MQSIPNILAGTIQRHASLSPGKLALHCAGQDTSYAALWAQVQQACAGLQAMRVRRGDRVAWLGLNDPAMLVLLFALARIGAILVPLNYRLAAAEQQAILTHAGASLLVRDQYHADAAQALANACGMTVAPAMALLAGNGEGAGTPADDADDAPVLLVYTSGTTGRPKGALHTQAALLANCAIATQMQEIGPLDHVLSALPLFHVGGLCIQTLPALHAGASVTLHPRFDAQSWLADVQLRKPDLSLLVPAALRAVLEHPHWPGADLSSLRLLVTGSSIVPTAMIDAVHRRGVPVGQIYGSTETGPATLCLGREDAMAQVGAAGKPGPDVEVRLVDQQGSDVAPGAVGEIWVRAPNLMSGYWRDPGHADFCAGWFHSGDLARQDEAGFYYMVGRCRDMIISGGENIYPAEIENVLATCADIVELAVLGQADARWGEVVVAVIVKRPLATLDAAAVLGLLEGRVARYKMPRRVLFCDELPKTALGKVQRAVLRDWVAAQEP